MVAMHLSGLRESVTSNLAISSGVYYTPGIGKIVLCKYYTPGIKKIVPLKY